MDILEFIQKSEWAVVVGGGLFFFRDPIKELLRGLRPRKFKGYGVEAEFDTALLETETLTMGASSQLSTAKATSSIPAPLSEPGNANEAAAVSPQIEDAAPDTLPDPDHLRLAPPYRTSPSPKVQIHENYQSFLRIFTKIAGIFAAHKKPAEMPMTLAKAAEMIGLSPEQIEGVTLLQRTYDLAMEAYEQDLSTIDVDRFYGVSTNLATLLVNRYRFEIWDKRLKVRRPHATSEAS